MLPSSTKLRTIAIAFALLIGVHGPAQILGTGSFDKKRVPIAESRIFIVQIPQRKLALEILGKSRFIKIDSMTLQKILPGKTIDQNAILQTQANEAISYAAQREKEAANPFFERHKDWMLKTACEHRKYAEYTLSLSGKLQPYLIHASAYNEGTGGFFATLSERVLSISHGSLGHSLNSLHDLPIVVFVETELVEVITSSSIAS